MTVQTPDGFPETGASAARTEELPEKFLDIEALTRAFVDEVVSGSRSSNERFHVKAEPHHRRARYLDRAGELRWIDVKPGDLFEVTTEVRERADAVLESRRPMVGPHPHNMAETWRDDGKCIVKSCGVWQERRETPR